MSGIAQMLLGGMIHDPFIANVISTQYFNSLTDQQGSVWSLYGSGSSVSGGKLIDPYATGSSGGAVDTFTTITGDFTLEFDFTCDTNNTSLWNSYPLYQQNVCSAGTSSNLLFGIALNKTGTIQCLVDTGYGATTGVLVGFPTGLLRFAIVQSGLNNYFYLNGSLIASISVPAAHQVSKIYLGQSSSYQSGNQLTAYTIDNVRLTRAARYSGSSYSLPSVPYPYS